ncbi:MULTISPECIES: hypothetical protein [Streptomyces]|uniref:Secreted protein n=1 Tax=Streptomyces amritsarensis TaxID=681158 RepID=A0ABX3G4Z4_9ACTN|nr:MULTISPECIES: hypothetical protein [Streptomyces]AQT73310.1 hypothetical protein B1K54_18180 [Streptomyces sp. fd1-xmd]OLZ68767.1 hypothetical protein AVW11_11220 [Streptomyces amritsarensis]
MNLRLIGIGAGVLIILSLPLAGAIAGPDFAGQDDGKGGGLFKTLGLSGPARSSPAPAGRPAEPAATEQPRPAEQPRTDSRCGPELTSPQGVEAQTCVLVAEGQTWGRSYYRNTSGRALDAVLTVMGPAGRTVQIRCPVGAGDEPGLCETPKEDSGGGPESYSAVAEFAVPDDEGQLLLRSGSNSPAHGDG